MTTKRLLERQESISSEAHQVAAELDLMAILGAVGEPVRVGSSALGVMVRRDLDVTVVCRELDRAAHLAVARIGADLAVLERVREVRFRDDTGMWNTDPRYPDGLYLGVSYRALDGADWTLDIWFVDRPDRQPDLEHLRTLAPRLDDDHRALVLAIKEELASRPADGVASYEVYRAVLDHGVTTAAEFDSWREDQE
ncbi:hypothetical protein AB0I53_02920 [Saccharopolyspora sp. NPDC050389]|uniref:hypothetical protein n=1 Tax=Saccharopolyspora sp. NPDC050389 TaxID=3155516 RepID=UPI00340452D5